MASGDSKGVFVLPPPLPHMWPVVLPSVKLNTNFLSPSAKEKESAGLYSIVCTITDANDEEARRVRQKISLMDPPKPHAW